MLVAVLSDIHANLPALRTALQLAEARGADALVNLGDVVGYGPSPSECLEIVRTEFAVNILGNHDAAVAGSDDEALPRDGRAAVDLHRAMLSDDQRVWLRDLPLVAEAFDSTFVHAAPFKPEKWPRLESMRDTQIQFDAFDTPICFIGHSHRQAIVADTLGVFRVREGHRYLVNVGSVGQPRDRDPRLGFALFDTEAFTVELLREHYDRAQTVAEIAKVGLPKALGDRLQRGV
ncbi:MAG: YfcE family phosphodiesterase [Rhodothermaceae bacterium]|nr:YfcE family phosphodiesterase [Rhodothermaceae bacterium]MAQ93810.1 YfcE family phosphodiesterase [Rhodothermaceae bacterium]